MLTIPKVGAQDAGTYSVVATNEKGRDVSGATLVVDGNYFLLPSLFTGLRQKGHRVFPILKF